MIQKRTRTRNGCLTCRDRHLKCDEQKPICGNCLKSNRVCYQGLRLNFSQYHLYTPENSSQNVSMNGLLDQSLTVASYYENGLKSYAPYRKYHTNEDLMESERQFEYDTNVILPPLKKQKSTNKIKKNESFTPSTSIVDEFDQVILENIDLTNILSSNISVDLNKKLFNKENVNPMNFDDYSSQSQSEYENEHYHLDGNLNNTNNKIIIETTSNYLLINRKIKPITSLPESKLLMSYTQNSCWLMDLFNSKNIWKKIIPNFAISESIILNALLACGASCYTPINQQTIQTYKKISTSKQPMLSATSDLNKQQLEKFLLTTNLVVASEYYTLINTNNLIGSDLLIQQLKLASTVMNYEVYQDSLIIESCFVSHLIIDVLTTLITSKLLIFNPYNFDFLFNDLNNNTNNINDIGVRKNDSWWVRKIFQLLFKVVYIYQIGRFDLFDNILKELKSFEINLPIVLNPIIFSNQFQSYSSNSPPGGFNLDNNGIELGIDGEDEFPKIIFNNEKAMIIHIFHHFIYLFVEKNYPMNYSILKDFKFYYLIYNYDLNLNATLDQQSDQEQSLNYKPPMFHHHQQLQQRELDDYEKTETINKIIKKILSILLYSNFNIKNLKILRNFNWILKFLKFFVGSSSSSQNQNPNEQHSTYSNDDDDSNAKILEYLCSKFDII